MIHIMSAIISMNNCINAMNTAHILSEIEDNEEIEEFEDNEEIEEEAIETYSD